MYDHNKVACSAVRKISISVALLTIASALSGCAATKGGPERKTGSGYAATILGTVFILLAALAACSPSIIGAPKKSFSDENDIAAFQPSVGSGAIQQYLAAGTDEEKRTLRNNIVLGRMYIIDRNYSDFERELTKERQDVGFYSSIALLALNSTGTLVGGEETKAILHAVSAGLLGAREAYGKEILIEKTIDILQKNMRARRIEIQNQIISSLPKPVTQYPLQLALSDVDKYFSAGTITGAFLGASNVASARLENAEFEALVVRDNLFLRSATSGR